MKWVALLVVALGFAAMARPAQACSPPLGPELRFFLFEAPAGGLWWVHGVDERFNREALPLVDEAGNEVIVSVVSLGAGGSAGLRVPDVAVGTRFVLHESLERPQDSAFDEFLVVGAGAVAETAGAPQAPTIAIEQRETRVGYASVLVSPIGGECTVAGAPGFWNIHYDERPFLIVDDPGDDVVLDVQLQTVDEDPFVDTESGNEILFDAHIAAAMDTSVNEPPGAVDVFNVHARVRRIADGAVSDVVTIEVPIDDVPADVRLEWVGCSCVATSPAASAPAATVLLVALAVRRRRRSAM